MPTFTLSRVGLTTTALLLSQTALADVTPAQVWGDWKQYMQNLGYEISATEATSGGDLSLSDIAIAIPVPETGGTMQMTMGPMTFAQNGGSVDIVMPENMPFGINGAGVGPEGENMAMMFTLTQSGHSLNVSGTPEEMVYDYAAAAMGMTLDQMQMGDESFGAENARMALNATGVTSTTTTQTGDTRSYSQTGGFEAVQYDIFIDNPSPDEPAVVTMTGTLNGMTYSGNGVIPAGANMADMAAMLSAGMQAAGGFTYTAGSSNVQIEDPENGNFAYQTTSTGGSLEFGMTGSQINYGGTQNNLQMNIQAADLPFPVSISMAESGFNLAAPIAKTDTPEDFAFGLTLGNFEMSDLIWSVFDPAAQLPRDPATIKIDLTGKAKMLTDLMNPEAQMMTGPPAELHALTIANVLVDAVGATLQGSGDITFDNTDMTSYGGMPKPVGTVDLSLVGGNGLMDKLVAMGLVPQDEMMGMRMMMGAFTVPGDAPDSVSSKIEFTPTGGILANGQQIR